MDDHALDWIDDGRSWPIEYDSNGPFRWTRPEFEIRAKGPQGGHLLLEVASLESNGNQLSIMSADAEFDQVPLVYGWQRLCIPLASPGAIRFKVASSFRAANDDRELGLMVRSIAAIDDIAFADLIRQRHLNYVRNTKEFEDGAEVLATVPPMLRITASRVCNIANEKACVYCSWDWAKRHEVGALDQTPEFLRSMGQFLTLSTEVNDCSYGELPLERDFGEIVDMATQAGRLFQFTSNGQTLGPRVRARMLGKSVRVYVSLDSATSAGFNRYRDHRFDRIIENLRNLCREKEQHGNLPEVYVSFIVMRSNLDEIEAFLELMHDIGVDRVVFRSLYLEDHLDERRTRHYGYDFDYDAECLGAEELAPLGEVCEAVGLRLGIPVVVEWRDFAENAGPTKDNAPICSEPWRTAYVLNRGITPCCYGREPIVDWPQTQSDNFEEGLRDAINSEPMRELRRDLAAGRLGKYCDRAQGCPIVKEKRLSSREGA